jgi:hypothetical protein
VAELGVRQQRAVDEHGAADAGAERQHDHGAAPVAARAEPHLREACGVGVVQHHDRAGRALVRSSPPMSQPIQAGSMLAAVCVTPCFTTAGTATPMRAVCVSNCAASSRHGGRDRLGRRRLRRQELVPLDQQPSRRHVHRRALDPGTADVDAQHAHRPLLTTSPSAARRCR